MKEFPADNRGSGSIAIFNRDGPTTASDSDPSRSCPCTRVRSPVVCTSRKSSLVSCPAGSSGKGNHMDELYDDERQAVVRAASINQMWRFRSTDPATRRQQSLQIKRRNGHASCPLWRALPRWGWGPSPVLCRCAMSLFIH